MICLHCAIEMEPIQNDVLGTVCSACMCTITPGAYPRGVGSRRLLKVAYRDNWICQLCRQPVNPKAKDEKTKATKDHIIPRSQGGPNAYGNLQLAHAKCNRLKGNNR